MEPYLYDGHGNRTQMPHLPLMQCDFKDQLSFYDLIREINEESGVTVVLVSHDLATVRRLAHQALCLRSGGIVRQGPPADVLTPEAVQQTFQFH